MADPAFAEWLQSESRAIVAFDSVVRDKWVDLARSIDAPSALHSEAGAVIEAARQLAFGGEVLAEESVAIVGIIDVAAVRGRCHAVIIPNHPDYSAGATVFVLGGYVDHGSGITNLTVLRSL